MKKLIAIFIALICCAGVCSAEMIRIKSTPATYFYRADEFSDYILVDIDGNTLAENISAVSEIPGTGYRVTMNGLIGFMRRDGSWIVPPRYTVVEEPGENGLAPAAEGTSWGYIDAGFDWAIEPRFQNAAVFSEGLAAALENGLYGYINEDGAWVIEPQFEYASAFTGGYATAALSDFRHFGVIDTEGNFVVSPELNAVNLKIIRRGLCAYYSMTASAWGIIFEDGSVLEPTYGFIDGFKDNELALVTVGDEHGNEKYGIIDGSGSIVAEPVYDSLIWDTADTVVAEVDGRKGLIRTDGSVVLEAVYDDIVCHDSSWYSLSLNGLYGVADIKGNVIFEPAFDKVYGFLYDDYLIVTKLDGLYGIVNLSGDCLLAPVYESFENRIPGDLFIVGQSGFYGIVRTDGSFAVEPVYDYIEYYRYNGTTVCAVKKDGMRAFVDTDGNLLTGFDYYFLRSARDGMYVVEVEGKCGVLGPDFTWIIEPVYKYIYHDSEYAFTVLSAEDGWGLISRDGRNLTEFVYDSMTCVDDSGTLFTAVKDGVTYRITCDGNGQSTAVVVENNLSLQDYYPFTGSRAAVPDTETAIAWREDCSLPSLDGATALLPVYSAFVQAWYPDSTRYYYYSYSEDKGLITSSKTAKAYERLINGEVDVIFCAQPSDEEILASNLAGVELEYTPIGYEAFVFIVSTDNPVCGLGADQIRGIYSGQITDWEQLGISGLGGIKAYQRPKNSGSQTALENFMGDIAIMEPLTETVSDEMMGIVTSVQSYAGYPDSIGYSFRFFCEGMLESDVKLLAVDGVAPTAENIRNGSYPIITTLYAVSRKGETNPNVALLLEAVTGTTGQELVEKTGYIPLNG